MRTLPALFCAIALIAGYAHADVIVIVSAKSPIKSLSNDQASDLFLGKVADFPDGTKATPLDQNEGSSVRDTFYRKSTGKAPAQMKAHWARMLFTGRAQPPVESGDSESIKKLVAANPGLIGYIDKAALDNSVRPVLVIH